MVTIALAFADNLAQTEVKKSFNKFSNTLTSPEYDRHDVSFLGIQCLIIFHKEFIVIVTVMDSFFTNFFRLFSICL